MKDFIVLTYDNERCIVINLKQLLELNGSLVNTNDGTGYIINATFVGDVKRQYSFDKKETGLITLQKILEAII